MIAVSNLDVHVKDWGGELWIVNTDAYCGKRLTVRKGMQSSLHYHLIKDETFFVESGLIQFEIDGHVLMLRPGNSVRVLPGLRHRFSGFESSDVFEFSTHHDEADVYRIEPSCPMKPPPPL